MCFFFVALLPSCGKTWKLPLSAQHEVAFVYTFNHVCSQPWSPQVDRRQLVFALYRLRDSYPHTAIICSHRIQWIQMQPYWIFPMWFKAQNQSELFVLGGVRKGLTCQVVHCYSWPHWDSPVEWGRVRNSGNICIVLCAFPFRWQPHFLFCVWVSHGQEVRKNLPNEVGNKNLKEILKSSQNRNK